MKYVLALLLGLLLGAAAAAGLVYVNPMIETESRSAPTADWELDYRLERPNLLSLTHASRRRMPVRPQDIPLLWESGVRGVVLAGLRLDDESGAAQAVATRISVPSAAANLVDRGALVHDYWLVTAPGAGSVVVHAESNLWPLLRDTIVRVDLMRREFDGGKSYTPVQGPRGGAATVTGLTGAFEGVTGRAFDRIEIPDYAGRFDTLTGELSLAFDAPAD